MNKITLQQLKDMRACRMDLKRFEDTFGQEAEITAENWKKAEEEGLDLEWLIKVMRQRLPDEIEALIATSAQYSYYYAKDVIKGRWEPGEAAIATSAQYSYCYAEYVIKGRFELGEAAIATSAWYFEHYNELLKGVNK